jgi:hypothetical protein
MSRRPLTIGFIFLGLLAGSASSAWAQGWTLDAYAGRAVFDPVSANVGTKNLSLGLRYAGLEGGWLYLFGAAPLADANPYWAAAGLGRRFIFTTRSSSANILSAGLDLGAHGLGFRDPATSDPGGGATFEAFPFVALQRGAARLELRSGLLQYAGRFAGETESRTIYDSGARLVLSAATPLELTGEARYLRTEEGGYPYLGAAATMHHGRGELWASAGRWLADALSDLSWGAGASLELGQRFELWAALRQEAPDPIYWNGARRSWNIGVSRRLGAGARPATPVPPPVPPPVEVSGGEVIIRLPLSAAKSAPAVAGDFTGWEPRAMIRSGDFWQVSLSLQPGVYHYAFRAEDGTWFVPESMPGRRDDGFGGYLAVLTVP